MKPSKHWRLKMDPKGVCPVAERRARQRYRMEVPVIIEVGGEHASKEVIPAHSRDISTKGVYVLTKRPLKWGSNMLITLILPTGKNNEPRNAMVVREEEAGMALRFVSG